MKNLSSETEIGKRIEEKRKRRRRRSSTLQNGRKTSEKPGQVEIVGLHEARVVVIFCMVYCTALCDFMFVKSAL